MIHKNCRNYFFVFFLVAFFVFNAIVAIASDSFNIEKGCGVTINDAAAGQITCNQWQRGSQFSVEGVDAALCICANTCLKTPSNHYYYDDPVAKTRQIDENAITLPVVLAWDNVEGWGWEDGEYLWHMLGVGGKKAATSKIYSVRSYVLEIDNTDSVLADPQSAGGIFRRVLKTPEFNPLKEFDYPCFFNSGRTIKWRVRPCCNEDGSDCLALDRAEWWEFKTSFAPEPIIANDPDWNGVKGAEGISFKDYQIKWCKVYLPQSKQYAKSYRLEVASDEAGPATMNCHPLMFLNGQCKADDILSDSQTGEVVTLFPVKGRQDHALFTRDRTYVWKMKTCFDDNAADCSSYGQSWKFSTKTDSIGIPEAITPKNNVQDNDLAGLPLNLSWSIPDGANSFMYQASFLTGDQKTGWSTVPNNAAVQEEKNKFDADNLKVDTEYKWRVKACSKFDSTNCDDWSDWFALRTTGRPPKADSLAATQNIPVIFSWEAVAGAKAYNFRVSEIGGQALPVVLSDPGLLKDPKYTLGYPGVDQGKNYVFMVQTCAHPDGKVCGAWSQGKTFSTPKLAAAINPKPANGSVIYADQIWQNISWDAVAGASAYRYVLSIVSSNEKQDCAQPEINKIISSPSDIAGFNCLGMYRLTVQPCVDSACESTGPKSEWTFTLDQRVPAVKSSFAVCGTGYDDPATSWNERTACQPKHILLLVKAVLDFVIFYLSILILPILVLFTGLIFYSRLKTAETWKKVKTMWKAIGIGYALLFSAWVLTGIVLSVLGFGGVWWSL